ncbi:nucleobase:cation symporter-2 family protein [Streptomyces sp. NPDC059524]|uniref:nucleobase:cation symporter-2 family protein n=1 Tax=Streptomyces sp. NPDC059524 TaxID=3346856 RepID=UPI0036C8444C
MTNPQVADVPCHPVDEKLPARKLIPSALQHIAAMYSGVVAAPLVIGPTVGLSAGNQVLLISVSLFIAGLCTLTQTLGVGKVLGNRLPFVNAAASGGIAPLLAIGQNTAKGHELQTMLGSLLVAGAVCLVIGPFFGKLMRFFPHLVTGVVITLIGVSLMPVPVRWAQGGAGAENFGSTSNLALAAFTLVIIVAMQRLFTGFLRQISLILGMVIGTLAAVPFGMLNTKTFESAPLVSIPTPFHFGMPEFQIAGIISMTIMMLVLMTESAAGMLAVGEICDRPVDGRTISSGLRIDGLGTMIGSLFGGFAISAFAQNIGVVSLTKVRSRFVVATAGAVLLVLGVFPVLGAVVSLVPMPVLGGAGLVLFGTIAISGVRTLSRAHLDEGANIVIAAVSLGVGLIPLAAPEVVANGKVVQPGIYHAFPDWAQTILGTGICAGAITAVLLNIAFNHLGKKKPQQRPEPEARPAKPTAPAEPVPAGDPVAGQS